MPTNVRRFAPPLVASVFLGIAACRAPLERTAAPEAPTATAQIASTPSASASAATTGAPEILPVDTPKACIERGGKKMEKASFLRYLLFTSTTGTQVRTEMHFVSDMPPDPGKDLHEMLVGTEPRVYGLVGYLHFSALLTPVDERTLPLLRRLGTDLAKGRPVVGLQDWKLKQEGPLMAAVSGTFLLRPTYDRQEKRYVLAFLPLEDFAKSDPKTPQIGLEPTTPAPVASDLVGPAVLDPDGTRHDAFALTGTNWQRLFELYPTKKMSLVFDTQILQVIDAARETYCLETNAE